MWFLGLLIGAAVGVTLGGVSGALVGAVLGAVAGWQLAASREAPDARRLSDIEDAIRKLHARVRGLEEAAAGRAPVGGEHVALTPAAAVPAPEPGGRASTTPGGLAPPAEEPPAAAIAPTREEAPAVAVTAAGGTAVATKLPGMETMAAWWQRMLGGNLVAKLGVVTLFFGVGFLLKYAYDNAWLPVPVRLAGVAALGGAMAVAGWRLTATRRLYGLILEGGGAGLVYLDVFFALRNYALIDHTLGFALFAALGVATTVVALRQDAKALAVLGLSGAFLAPVLAGGEAGGHVTLFSYYALLNGCILVVSWFKAWRDLNLAGFIFTFVVGLAWGADRYRPEHFATVEPFVVVFFAIYLVIPILFAQRQPPQLKGVVDGVLVFGTPLAAAFMQAALVRNMPYGLAWSAGGAALLYAGLALATLRHEALRVLGEAYAALSVVFFTLALFFALDAYPTFALWTLEGAAVTWVGLRQGRRLACLFGVLLQFVAAFYFLVKYESYDFANPWVNDFVIGCALIAAAGLLTSRLIHKHREVPGAAAEAIAMLLLAWGCGWWLFGGWHALDGGLPRREVATAMLLYVSLSCAVAERVGAWLAWPALRRVGLVLAVALALTAVAQLGSRDHPSAHWGWIAWPVAASAFYWTLARQERSAVALGVPAQHAGALWLFGLLAGWELSWRLYDLGFARSWRTAGWGLVAAFVLGLISRFGTRISWPFAVHFALYRGVALAPVAVFAALWSLYAVTDPAYVSPLPYVPLANPLDGAQLLLFVALKTWDGARGEPHARSGFDVNALIAVLAFIWLNSMVLRSVHHWTATAYTLPALLDSVLVQAALSLVWTVTALVVMAYGARAARRRPWIAGAGLLAVVVAKLFIFDLASLGTIERIVTFIGVGVGLLVIGYVAPVPPGEQERESG